MAFDFNGKRQPPRPSAPPRQNIDPVPQPDSFPRPGGSRTAGGSGFQNRPTVRGGPTSPPHPSAPLPSRGKNGPSRYSSPRPLSYGGLPRGSRWESLPWNLILPIGAVVALVIFLWIFRHQITAFLTQVLSWIIIILIIYVVIRWILFPRRR